MPKPYPDDLESSYSILFKRLIRKVNKEYLKLLRPILKEIEDNKINSIRTNAMPSLRSVFKKIRSVKKKMLESFLLDKTIANMQNVFNRMVDNIVDGIEKGFKKKKFPIPNLDFKNTSNELEKAVKLNVELISDVTEEQMGNLEEIVLESVKGNVGKDKILEEVERVSDKGEHYAEFVARDQVAKAQGAMNKEAQTRAGFPGYIWRAVNDLRTREKHGELDGEFFLWTKPPLIGDRNLHPGEDYQCRCIAEPAFDKSTA